MNFNRNSKNLNTMFENISLLDEHKNIAMRQRKKYYSEIENLKPDCLLIEIDWKQKIVFGLF